MDRQREAESRPSRQGVPNPPPRRVRDARTRSHRAPNSRPRHVGRPRCATPTNAANKRARRDVANRRHRARAPPATTRLIAATAITATAHTHPSVREGPPPSLASRCRRLPQSSGSLLRAGAPHCNEPIRPGDGDLFPCGQRDPHAANDSGVIASCPSVAFPMCPTAHPTPG